MERLKEIKSRFEKIISDEISKETSNIHVEDLYKACDMLKDTAETMYYCSIVNAMEEGRELKLDPETYRTISRMYYTEEPDASMTEESRHKYIMYKTAGDSASRMQALEEYSKSLMNDVMGMLQDATDNEKQMIRNKLQMMAQKI